MIRECAQGCFQIFRTIFNLLLLTSVTSAGVERGNSSLKYIKNDFRSRMSETRLNALLLFYEHKDIDINLNEVVDMYAKKKTDGCYF